jgi:hypothetical protein
LKVINKPVVSKTIALAYGVLCTFIATLIIFFLYAGFFTPMGISGFVAAIGVSVIEIIILLILRSLYTTKYVLTDHQLEIQTTKLIGGNKIISLNSIESIEKTLIPFAIRLFGASFHGGYYRIPSVGRAFLAITNYNDGLLIKSKKGNYIITPKDPLKFKKIIENVFSVFFCLLFTHS